MVVDPSAFWAVVAAAILAAVALARAPVGVCERCDHCLQERVEAQRRQREVDHDYDHEVLGHCSDGSCPRNRRPRDE